MFRNRARVGLLAAALGVLPMAAGAAPADDAKAAVKAYFARLDAGEGDSDPLLALPAKDVIPELERYLGSGTEEQQGHAVRLIALIGRAAPAEETRAQAVQALLDHATGKAAEKAAARQALEGLTRFAKSDFPPEAGARIEKLVRADAPPPEALLLAGVAEVRSVVADLRKLADAKPDGDEPFAFRNPAWAAHLALARLGEAGSVKHVFQAVEAEKDVVQRVRRFGDLLYTRQPEALRLLARYLASEERLPPVRTGTPGTKVALYALDALADHAAGFPIKSENGPSYTDAQLAAARKWVKEQKELAFQK